MANSSFNGRMVRCVGAAMLTAALATAVASGAESAVVDWPAFRGDGRNLTDAELPSDWSIKTGRNVAWTATLPGRGVSSPIVVAGRVIVTCSDGPEERRLLVLAFDAESGGLLWRRDFEAQGSTVINETTAVAANTPTTDGRRIFAIFSSNDFYALDLDGKTLWSKRLTADDPELLNDFGMASSPTVVDGAVVVQCNGETTGFVAAFEAEDGKQRWRQERPNQSSWASPYVLRQPIDGGELAGVIVQTPKAIQFLNGQSGAPVWSVDMECDGIASSTWFEERVYVPAKWLMAVEYDSALAAERPVWEARGLKPSSASPVVRNGKIYAVNRGGILNCYDLASEEITWTRRLGGTVWATPLLARQRLYCFNAKGTAFVLDLNGDLIAEVEMGEELLASPAVSGNAMFVRSHGRLWKIAE